MPGNKADIIATRGTETYTLLKNVKILAIDQTATTDQNKPAVVRALTLEVTPKQAETLVQAMQSGRLQFTLRNPMDTVEPSQESAPTTNKAAGTEIKPIAKPPVTINILPWNSQKFIKCEEEQSC